VGEARARARTFEGRGEQLFHMYRAAFPDLRMEPQDILVSGDKVVARVRGTGTQGEFMGMPATGKRVDVELIDIIRSAESPVRWDPLARGCRPPHRR
jgi:predicted ester cyclase